eukprot:gene15255-6463_t
MATLIDTNLRQKEWRAVQTTSIAKKVKQVHSFVFADHKEADVSFVVRSKLEKHIIVSLEANLDRNLPVGLAESLMRFEPAPQSEKNANECAQSLSTVTKKHSSAWPSKPVYNLSPVQLTSKSCPAHQGVRCSEVPLETSTTEYAYFALIKEFRSLAEEALSDESLRCKLIDNAKKYICDQHSFEKERAVYCELVQSLAENEAK